MSVWMRAYGAAASVRSLYVRGKRADAVNPAEEGLDWWKLLVRELTQYSKGEGNQAGLWQ